MRHIDKDLNDIPNSLKPATKYYFADGKIPKSAEKTHLVRVEMSKTGIYSEDADALYKSKDIKEKLESIYYHKCAYCEQKVEAYHVEHYRPKNGYHNKDHQQHKGYPYFALSWDNLLLSCTTCNSKKGSKFDIKGTRVNLSIVSDFNGDWENYNSLSLISDQKEEPLLLNPERCNPDLHLNFHKDGSVVPKTPQGSYTIETCDLNRTYLRDNRRKIIDEFKKRIESIIISDSENLIKRLEEEISFFMKNSLNNNLEYTLFRKQSLHWLNEIISEIVNS
ncbi:MAG: hypothetical protein MJ211_05345 [Bacteroidales bacterium]|nr:hypothetical protein [Bacteroidales bacterium]